MSSHQSKHFEMVVVVETIFHTSSLFLKGKKLRKSIITEITQLLFGSSVDNATDDGKGDKGALNSVSFRVRPACPWNPRKWFESGSVRTFPLRNCSLGLRLRD